jgi:hypothetical protein
VLNQIRATVRELLGGEELRLDQLLIRLDRTTADR